MKDDLPGVSLPPSPGNFNSQVAIPEVRPPHLGPPIETLTRDLGATRPAAPSDLDVHGGPLARRDGTVVELTRYQQSGKVQVDGDTVTQQLGRGRTAGYSLSQLAAHSKDPYYFANTVTYAAKRGDSVTIDVRDGVARVADPALEHRLPRDFPYSDAILHAAARHQIDPALLAAVGEQESGMGKGVNYNQTTHIGGDGHGHGMWQMDDRYNSKADCERAGRDPYYAADKAAQQLSSAIASDGAPRGIQSYNARDPALPYYQLVKTHLESIEGQLSQDFGKNLALMKRARFVACAASLLALLGASPDGYPSRPSAVRVHYMTGRLVDYVLGNHSGGLAIIRQTGERDSFFIAYPNKINGHHYLCQQLPFVGMNAATEGLCSEKPRNIVVGRTLVHVTYWWGTVRGKAAKISDEIMTVSTDL